MNIKSATGDVVKDLPREAAGQSLALGERQQVLAKVIDYLQSHKRIDPRAHAKLVGAAQANDEAEAAKFLARFVATAKSSKASLWTFAWQIHDGCKAAAQAYHRIMDGAPRDAGVLGPARATALERWDAAHEVVRQAARMSKATPELAIETGPARETLVTLASTIRAFAEAQDAMLRGEKPVSDVYPEATLLALFPSLVGKDLPALLDELARVVEGAPKGLLLGLFNHRWLEHEGRGAAVPGPLPGDLNEVVARLRDDARRLREGYVFGPSAGFGGVRGVDPLHTYVKGDAALEGEGYGILPTFIMALARPQYARENFTFGDAARAAIPTYQGKAAPGLTMTVGVTRSGTTQLVIG